MYTNNLIFITRYDINLVILISNHFLSYLGDNYLFGTYLMYFTKIFCIFFYLIPQKLPFVKIVELEVPPQVLLLMQIYVVTPVAAFHQIGKFNLTITPIVVALEQEANN